LSTTTTLARFETVEAADRATQALADQGFEPDQIGLLMSDATHRAIPVRVKDDHSEEGILAGSAVGLIAGGLIGLVAGPPGFVLGGGLAALWGAITGGAAGSLAGMLIGMGIPRDEAQVIEERLEVGEVLVTVTTRDPTRTTLAEVTLNKQGASSTVRSYVIP